MKRLLIIMQLSCFLLIAMTACSISSPAITVLEDRSGTPQPESTGEAEGNGRNPAANVSSEAASRTPVPTLTPGFIDREINQAAAASGLGGFTFLGLTAADWINIVISILIFLIGYVILTRLLSRLLLEAVKRTKTEFDDGFLHTVGPEIERVIGIILLGYVIRRLDFLSIPIKSTISDILFVLGLILAVIICLKLVNFTAAWYMKALHQGEQPDEQSDAHADKHRDSAQLDPEITLLQHASYILIIAMGFLIGLVHFGVEISIVTSILLIVGLGIVIGARTILGDLVGGFIILVGRPFRVGDAIELEGWQYWGIVEIIGSRVTQVRTADNRKVIIPNSMASSGQLVNYSYPDPEVRLQSDIRISYDADLDQIRKLISDAVRGTEGVLLHKPVEVLYREFGDSTRRLRVRWWISEINSEYYSVDTVNSAIEGALTHAGIEIPYTTVDLSVNQGQDSSGDTDQSQKPESSEQESA